MKKEDTNLFPIPYAKPAKRSSHCSSQGAKLLCAFKIKLPETLAESAMARHYLNEIRPHRP